MADRKLFELETAIPKSGDMFAFGNMDSLGSTTGTSNITFADLKSAIMGGAVKTKTFEIGAWNMVTQSSPSLYVILSYDYDPSIFVFIPPSIPVEKIRGIRVVIRNDNNNSMTDFLSVQNGTDPIVPLIQIEESIFLWETTFVRLTRRAGSTFTNTTFSKTVNTDSTPYNRGWVTVDYID